MLGLLDKQPWPSSPIVSRMTSPRFLSRRTLVVLFIFCAFMSVMMFSSKQLGQICEDGKYCRMSGLRGNVPNLGNEDGVRNATTSHGKTHTESTTLDDECALFPNTSSVLVVMKTGASESYNKIPTQLMTNLKCLPDFLIFSDMAQKIAGYTIHDSLETVLDEVKEKNKDFELYHRQKQCPIDQEQCNKKHDVASQGWNLDKYKNIHMAEKAYHARPNYDWYLFVDADTYVVFPTLMEWLKRLNPNKQHYIGSVAMLGDFPFGHGGSGYLVSKATMRSMFYGKSGIANKYDEPVQHTCCGDYMWSKALKDETGVSVVNAWPVINGEKPHTLPYAENEWCQPIVTMHHAAAEDISDLYAFEKERKFSKMLRIKDLYHKFVKPQLAEARPDWDNLSDDVFYLNSSNAKYEDWELNRAKKDDLSDEEAEAHKSFDDCKKACLSLDNCFQFRFQNGICAVSHNIKHGKPVKKGDDDSQRYMSGWNVEKIQEWIEEQGDCENKNFQWPVKDN